MDYQLEKELISILQELGSFKEKRIKDPNSNNNNATIVKKEYHIGEDCLKAARSLYRMLDFEDDNGVFQHLGNFNVVGNKLVPILIHHCHIKPLALVTLKILVKLTLQLQIHIESVDIQKQTEYFITYKESLLSKELFHNLLSLLREPMTNIAMSNGNSEDQAFIELILTLIKNILQIKDPLSTKSIDKEYLCTMHNDLILLLEETHILELFLVLAQNISTNKTLRNNLIYSFLLLEIFALLLKNDNPDKIWKTVEKEDIDSGKVKSTASTTTTTQGSEEADSLMNLYQREKMLTMNNRNRNISSSRSRFIGTFVSVNKDDGSKKVINQSLPQLKTKVQKVLPSTVSASLFGSRVRHAVPFNIQTPSSSKVLLVLKSWAEQFLDGCYNSLMSIVIRHISREDASEILESDRINFLFVTRFFTGFSLQLLQYHERAQKAKGSSPDTASHDNDDSDEEHLIGEHIRNNITDCLSSTLTFTNFQIILNICETYETKKRYKQLEVAVATLKEMIAILNFLSISSDEDQSKISHKMQSEIYYNKDIFLKKVIDLVRLYNPSLLSKEMLNDLVTLTFSTINMVETFCKKFNAIAIKKKKSRKAHSLNKKNKLVDSDDEDFVTKGDDDNIDNLIDDKEQQDKESQDPQSQDQTQEKEKEKDKSDDEDGDADADGDYQQNDSDIEEEDDEEDEIQTLKFEQFLAEFAQPDVIKNFSLALGNYHNNSEVMNYQITNFFSTISREFGLEPMFYQLSIFYLFKNLMDDQLFLKNPRATQLIVLIQEILTNFFKLSKENPAFFLDILYPKLKTDCYYMNNQKENANINDEDDDYKSDDGNGDKVLAMDLDNNNDDVSDSELVVTSRYSKLEDGLDKAKLGALVKKLLKTKKGQSVVEWIQVNMIMAIENRNREKSLKNFTPFGFAYTGNENYNTLDTLKTLFTTLKFRTPTSRRDLYTVPEYKTFNSSYLTTIYETIKSTVHQVNKEKESPKKSKKSIRDNSDDDGNSNNSDNSDNDQETKEKSEDDDDQDKSSKVKKNRLRKMEKKIVSSDNDEDDDDQEMNERDNDEDEEQTISLTKEKPNLEDSDQEQEQEEEEQEVDNTEQQQEEEEGKETDKQKRKREKKEKKEEKKRQKQERKAARAARREAKRLKREAKAEKKKKAELEAEEENEEVEQEEQEEQKVKKTTKSTKQSKKTTKKQVESSESEQEEEEQEEEEQAKPVKKSLKQKKTTKKQVESSESEQEEESSEEEKQVKSKPKPKPIPSKKTSKKVESESEPEPEVEVEEKKISSEEESSSSEEEITVPKKQLIRRNVVITKPIHNRSKKAPAQQKQQDSESEKSVEEEPTDDSDSETEKKTHSSKTLPKRKEMTRGTVKEEIVNKKKQKTK
ncbi:hypothetical protein CYY_005142 [Polysphondylium violaceum]|uniref:Timeless N-terminal domain-containing protein n=1 Tax=Polysphondylium violaceum TaxID=133409 RepID=A0A8J4PV84_9MYCE|nr:hypothetical protein CYY_005142 [Polysphondylium violaceum]